MTTRCVLPFFRLGCERKLTRRSQHVWSDTGVFNIEGGCYAKCVGLNAEKEPEIHGAIKFGSILENVTVRSPSFSAVVAHADELSTTTVRLRYP